MIQLMNIYTEAGLSSAARVLRKYLEQSNLTNERRRQIRKLQQMEDYLLRDIAVDRGDIEHAVMGRPAANR